MLARIVFGEEDKPFIDSYLKHAHAPQLTPDQVKANLEWYYKDREVQIAACREGRPAERCCARRLIAELGA